MTTTRHGAAPSKNEMIAAAASAALFALTFPPFALLIPAFVCLVPLAVGVARVADRPDGTIGSAARIGLWFGLLGYGANLYWIAVALSIFTWLASLGYVAALIWLAPWLALTTAVLFATRRLTRWPIAVLLPVVWVTSERVLLHLADLAFPWLPLGLGVSTFPHFAQLADLSGVHGLSFWLALSNGLLADAIITRRRYALRAISTVGLAVAVYAYGAWRLGSTPLVPLGRVTVVQPNVPEDEKIQEANRPYFMGIMSRATREAIAHGPQPSLIVWPEASLPDFLSQHAEWRDSLRALAATTHASLLFGVLDVVWSSPSAYEIYNAAEMADSTGVVGAQPSYHKEYLVPIVERVPFVNPRWFAGLKYFGGFGRGHDPEPYRVSLGAIGVLICYESIFPDLSRHYRLRGADLLANITNDAWFGRSLAPYQHVAHLRLRAIENRVGIVRSANTGISEYVDPLGRVHGATPLFVPAAPTFDVATSHVRTLYVRWGDWIGMLSAGLTVALCIAAYVTNRSRRRSQTSSPNRIDQN
jgi:apolipoprotein N-acyltransferase